MSRGRAWNLFRWCTRCLPGITVILLVSLTCIALWRHPRKRSVGDDGPWKAGHRHVPDTKHDHDDAYDLSCLISYCRRLFAYYNVFVHLMALVFPMRACWAVWQTGRQLKHIRPVRRPRSASIRTSTPREVREEQSLNTTCIFRSSSESSASENDADADVPSSTRLVHAILLPSYREDIDNIRETLEVLACHSQAAQCYDVYLAMEQREPASAEKASSLASEFSSSFRNVIITVHPSDIPGEAPGKSSNIAWAAAKARRRYSANLKYRLREHVIFTVMDSDSHLSANYFGLITDMHLEFNETAQTTIYVPPMIFDRNANSVPALVRVADLFWCGAGMSGLYDSSAVRPPTSVYSLPLILVERVGGWDAGPEAIGEDLHMYLKCFFALGGNLTARTVLSAASHSNVHSEEKGFRGSIGTHQARWKQAVRHMWGSLDTGYALRRLVDLCWYGYTRDDDARVPHSLANRRSSDAPDYGVPLLIPPSGTSASSSPNWNNILVLFHRLYEAHFLPLHLLTFIISSTLYTFTVPADEVPPEFNSVFKITSFLRLASSVFMFCYFVLYERFHRTCVMRREKEMQRAGLAERMQGSFAYRKFLPNAFDYVLFPIAGSVFGPIPAAYAQLCHFWTVDLAYTVSKKPQRIRPPMKATELV